MFSGLPGYIKFLFELMLFPFTKMEEIDPDEYMNHTFFGKLFSENEVILKAYNNPFRAFLITNMRIIGIKKLKITTSSNLFAKIFSLPLNQVGNIITYRLHFPPVNVIRLTTGPGFRFYWFFKRDVDLEELSKIVNGTVSNVQGYYIFGKIKSSQLKSNPQKNH